MRIAILSYLSKFFTVLSWCRSKAPAAAGVVLFNVVFHEMIPLVCDFLKFDRVKVAAAIIIGSAMPLVVYTIWLAVSLSAAGASSVFVDPVATMMNSGMDESKQLQELERIKRLKFCLHRWRLWSNCTSMGLSRSYDIINWLRNGTSRV